MSRISLQTPRYCSKRGEVVAVPTETVYGLAASLHYPEAIDRIYTLKKRPSDNPLIIHIADAAQIFAFTDDFPQGFEKITSLFWPGSLTIVLPVTKQNPLQSPCGAAHGRLQTPQTPLDPRAHQTNRPFGNAFGQFVGKALRNHSRPR